MAGKHEQRGVHRGILTGLAIGGAVGLFWYWEVLLATKTDHDTRWSEADRIVTGPNLDSAGAVRRGNILAQTHLSQARGWLEDQVDQLPDPERSGSVFQVAFDQAEIPSAWSIKTGFGLGYRFALIDAKGEGTLPPAEIVGTLKPSRTYQSKPGRTEQP